MSFALVSVLSASNSSSNDTVIWFFFRTSFTIIAPISAWPSYSKTALDYISAIYVTSPHTVVSYINYDTEAFILSYILLTNLLVTYYDTESLNDYVMLVLQLVYVSFKISFFMLVSLLYLELPHGNIESCYSYLFELLPSASASIEVLKISDIVVSI